MYNMVGQSLSQKLKLHVHRKCETKFRIIATIIFFSYTARSYVTKNNACYSHAATYDK